MSIATPWNLELAETVIAAEMSAARAFYADDGNGATALLPILHAIQHRFAYIPAESLALIADRLNISKAEVCGALSFYHDFDETPLGRHVLKLCRAEACQALGCEQTASHLENRYGLKTDATAAGVTLKNVYCLGNCALGPAALIGDELLARFDADAADTLMARLRETQR